ncbi:transcriptional regulator, LysR family [Desulfurobacterium thermolithotrophum DSM 11699]|uniref:Transcriptional regulator, LysR family n=1 Tax=Desulfurobacterium thermolithotrophum (strain DSM 11699 / BSA) TaxID=868864 RepID=F0S0W5_DESTD|nr:selenium metabolism-associated LysR family transcriptional regulator [Desulfurobacterium thermolithotrophum]ADY72769.1 transcriptional regulator, LysR family [Desulfurobacterium thermolithotrophum DSM 11699]
MDLRQLEVFSKVFELKSFSKAAEKLRISQPTVSAHIQNLEDELGIKLFDRMGRKILPTLEARILYRHAVELLKKKEEALSELLSVTKKSKGTLKLAVSNIPGDYLIPHILLKLKHLMPEVVVQVEIFDSKKVIKQLKEVIPEYDIGFVGSLITDQKLEYKKILDDEIVLIAPPYYNSEKMTLEDFKKLPLLIREEDSGTRIAVERALKEKGISSLSLNITAFLGSNTAIKEAVKKGVGFGLVSKYSIKEELDCNKLKTIKIEGLSIKRSFYAVRRNDITPIPAARTLWDNLEKLFNSKNT